MAVVREAFDSIVGLRELGNSSDVSTVELQRITEAASRVLDEDVGNTLAVQSGEEADSSKLLAGEEARSNIELIADAVRRAASDTAEGLEVTSKSLNISVQSRTPQEDEAVIIGGSGSIEGAIIKVPAVLARVGAAEYRSRGRRLADGHTKVTVSIWSTSTEVHGASLNESDAIIASNTVSYKIFVNDSQEYEFTDPVLLQLPASRGAAAGSASCIGQPDARDRLEQMKARAGACSEALECRFWNDYTRAWSTDGCRTVPLNSTGGLELGCECDRLGGESVNATDFIAIKVPVRVDDSKIELISLDPSRGEAAHCRCTTKVEAILIKLENSTSDQHVALDFIKDSGEPRPAHVHWGAELRGAMNGTLVRLLQSSGLVEDGLPLALSALGIAETPLGASERAEVLVDIGSPTGCTNVSVAFRASVFARAVASKTVWGPVADGSRCADAVSSGDTAMLLGETLDIVFTACDFEGFPVHHELPTAREALPDSRIFQASLLNVPGGLVEERVEVHSIGRGQYRASLSPRRPGNFTMWLSLSSPGTVDDATPITGPLPIVVACGIDLVQDAAGGCVCGRGAEPADGPPASCVACNPGYHKPLIGNTSCEACPAGTMQPAFGEVLCVACSQGESQPKPGQSQCTLCAAQTTSVEPFESCSECEGGTYRDADAEASTDACRPCHPLAECPLPNGNTLPTVLLKNGTWRLSNSSRAIQRCQARGRVSPCLGGQNAGVDGDGYCRDGHSGFRCEVCTDRRRYFDNDVAQCTDCRPTEIVAVVYLFVLGVPLLALWAMRLIEWRGHPVSMAKWLKRLRVSAKRSALRTKLKIIVGGAQIGAAASTFSIELPSTLRPLVRAFEWMQLDFWGELFIPYPCIGGYKTYMIATASSPFGAVLAIFSLHLLARRRKGFLRAFKGAAVQSLSWVLGLATLLAPTVTAAAFGAFHCRRVVAVSSPIEHRSFLWNSPGVSCDSHEAAEMRRIASVILGLWAIAPLVSLAIILLLVRRSVLDHVPTRLSAVSKVVWEQYEPACLWWAWLDLLRRIVLSGSLLLISDEVAFLRLLVALLFSLTLLFTQIYVRPYRNKQAEVLAAAVQTVATVLIVGYAYLFIWERFEALLSERSLVVWVMAFGSPSTIAAVLVALVAVLATAALAAIARDALYDTASCDFVLATTRTPPELSIKPHQKFHLFLSHTWSTGQDQCAAIKRQLQLHLPGVKVFLDVDDLRDIGSLEHYIEQSMVVAIFLSAGYFASRNCLREVTACVEKEKPLVLILEADHAKGGLTNEQAQAECPAEYREHVFGRPESSRLPFTWHRVREFQMRTLCLIASQMLLHSPKYTDLGLTSHGVDPTGPAPLRKDRPEPEPQASTSPDSAPSEMDEFVRARCAAAATPELELCLPKDLSFDLLGYKSRPPFLYASPYNPRSRAVAEELLACFKPSEKPSMITSLPESNPSHPLAIQRDIYFLLCLNSETWLGSDGRALADQVAPLLLHQTRVRLVLLHENDPRRGGCPFARFFQTTPTALIDSGIYKDIAVAMHAAPYRSVSCVLAAQAIGARPRVSRHAVSTLAHRPAVHLALMARDGSSATKTALLRIPSRPKPTNPASSPYALEGMNLAV